MNQAEVIAKMQPVFDDLFLEPVKLSSELSAKQVDEWDSLMQVSIVVGIEMAFGVRFRVGEVEATKNVGEFADLILRRLADNDK